MSSIIKTLSNKGKECIFVDDFRFSNCYIRKNGTKNWRCSCRQCPATVLTDDDCSIVLETTGTHSHAAVLGETERQVREWYVITTILVTCNIQLRINDNRHHHERPLTVHVPGGPKHAVTATDIQQRWAAFIACIVLFYKSLLMALGVIERY